MNYFNKAVIMLTLIAFISTNVVAMDRVNNLKANAKQLVRDLTEYNKCRGTVQGCSPQLMQRLQQAGATIAQGTAAVVAGAAAIGVTAYGAKRGYEKYKSSKKFQARTARDQWIGDLQAKYKFQDTPENIRFLRAIKAGDIPSMQRYAVGADFGTLAAGRDIASGPMYDAVVQEERNKLQYGRHATSKKSFARE